MKKLTYLLSIIAISGWTTAFSQQYHTGGSYHNSIYTTEEIAADSARQTDLIDLVQKFLDKKNSPQKRQLPKKAIYSVIPYAGYTLSTGFTADISGNVGFFTEATHKENLSVISADISYDSKSQKVFLTRSEIWGNGNKYKVVSDLRWEQYPTDTYGLGTSTQITTDNDINYYYVRIYETVLRKIGTDYYAGIGYSLDHHYQITAAGNADNSISDFEKYGEATESTSSGVNVDLLFDNRKNPLNPAKGTYANIIYRENLTLLGSDANWQLLQFDLRKYFKLSAHSNNVLAFWSIMAFTAGNVPYLDLPSTGFDMYNNSGRGYAIGRYRGKNMLYFEGEYRFGITANGLLGGVAFVNGESFSELKSNAFEKVAPAAGTGIRIKLNKHSNTNICIDYGVGTGGSHGFFVNLGEVF